MSAETDYLVSFLTSPYQLSLTVTSTQRPRTAPGAQRPWEPGLTSFGWANLGARVKDGSGTVVGLRFSTRVWFSDRVANRGASPTQWQQFDAAAQDSVVFTFTVAATHVHLDAQLKTWNAAWASDSFAFDSGSQQLLFSVPGAGAGAPPAILISSFGAGAGFV